MKLLWTLVMAAVSVAVLFGALMTAHTPWEKAMVAGVALIYLQLKSMWMAWAEQTVETAIGNWDQFKQLRARLGGTDSEEEELAAEQAKNARASFKGPHHYAYLAATALLYLMALGALVDAALSS